MVVTKKTSCVPMRMIAGWLFIAVTRGLDSTLTLPCVAKALSRPLKSPTFNDIVKPPLVAGASGLRDGDRLGQAADHLAPVDAGGELVAQLHLDHLRLDLHLALHAQHHGGEILLDPVEPAGAIGHLQQRRRAIEVHAAVRRQQRAHAFDQVAEEFGRVACR